MATGLLLFSAADLFWITVRNGSDPGAGAISAALWTLSFTSIAIASARDRRVAPQGTYEKLADESAPEPDWRVILVCLPAPFALVLVADQAFAESIGPAETAVIAGGLVVIATIILRLGLSVRESHRIQGELRHQVGRDPMTGLLRSEMAIPILTRELDRARGNDQSVTVAFLDIDNFKAINDGYGHQAADTAIISVAASLKKYCRDGTDLLTRYGGDEFVIVLPGLQYGDAYKVGHRLRNEIAKIDVGKAEAGTSSGRISVSIGLAVSRSCELPAEDLIAAADRTMYDAKTEGKNTVLVADADRLVRMPKWRTYHRPQLLSQPDRMGAAD